VEQSVDLLLGAPAQLTAAGSSSTHSAAAASTVGCREPVNAQVRSKDADGRLWVQFDTAAAAQQTLAAARMMEKVAGGYVV
jgi:hypothetical protein